MVKCRLTEIPIILLRGKTDLCHIPDFFKLVVVVQDDIYHLSWHFILHSEMEKIRILKYGSNMFVHVKLTI